MLTPKKNPYRIVEMQQVSLNKRYIKQKVIHQNLHHFKLRKRDKCDMIAHSFDIALASLSKLQMGGGLMDLPWPFQKERKANLHILFVAYFTTYLVRELS